jgi:hypothetical protein
MGAPWGWGAISFTRRRPTVDLAWWLDAAATMGILIHSIALACAAWDVAVIVQRPVAVFASTRFGPLPVAPTRTANPTTRFSLVIIWAAIALAARGWIARNASMVGIAVAIAVALR